MDFFERPQSWWVIYIILKVLKNNFLKLKTNKQKQSQKPPLVPHQPIKKSHKCKTKYDWEGRTQRKFCHGGIIKENMYTKQS